MPKTITQIMRAEVLPRKYSTPRHTDRTNMNANWIEDYDPERWHVRATPDLTLQREAAARVAMRFRSRRAARAL